MVRYENACGFTKWNNWFLIIVQFFSFFASISIDLHTLNAFPFALSLSLFNLTITPNCSTFDTSGLENCMGFERTVSSTSTWVQYLWFIYWLILFSNSYSYTFINVLLKMYYYFHKCYLLHIAILFIHLFVLLYFVFMVRMNGTVWYTLNMHFVLHYTANT